MNARPRFRILAGVALASSLAGAARADVSVQHFSPASNSTYIRTEDSLMELFPGQAPTMGRRLLFTGSYNWVNDPLVELNQDRTERLARLVDGINTVDVGAAYFFNRRLALNLAIPLHMVHLEGGSNQFAMGDARAGLKYRLTDPDAQYAFSIMPELRFPTGDGRLFVSDGTVAPGVLLGLERDFGNWRLAANIGYRYASGSVLRDLDYTHRIPLSLGAFVPFDPKWGGNLELNGAVTVPFNGNQNPSELYGGLRYQANHELAFLGGGSLGTISGARSNDMRVVFALKYSPLEQKEPPPVVESKPVVEAPKPEPKKPAPPKVVFTPQKIEIEDEVKFRHDSAELLPAGKRLLDAVADVIQKNRLKFKYIMIEGHTNELGTIPYNQTLSEKRAASVRRYLQTRGIEKDALESVGYGELKPKVVDGVSKEARLAINRRVEFKVKQ
jgi:outer membrane protein OmpA-like peptidoglycan-associated protein